MRLKTRAGSEAESKKRGARNPGSTQRAGLPACLCFSSDCTSWLTNPFCVFQAPDAKMRTSAVQAGHQLCSRKGCDTPQPKENSDSVGWLGRDGICAVFETLCVRNEAQGPGQGEGSQTGQAAEFLNEKHELRQQPVVQM